MQRGRKPKPTHLKLLAGVPGHRPLNDKEPQPDLLEETPQPPSHLSGEARTHWANIVPKLVRNGMLSEVDVPTIAAYCQAYGRWVAAESMVAKQGDVLISPSGFPIQNPYLAVANKAMEQMIKREVEFGMTPSSRSRVSSTAKPKKANRFLDLVGGSKTNKRA
jgi:P27 family predicted phage terminase small subunit